MMKNSEDCEMWRTGFTFCNFNAHVLYFLASCLVCLYFKSTIMGQWCRMGWIAMVSVPSWFQLAKRVRLPRSGSISKKTTVLIISRVP